MAAMGVRHGVDYLVLIHLQQQADDRPPEEWAIKVVDLAAAACPETVRIIVAAPPDPDAHPTHARAQEQGVVVCPTVEEAMRFFDTFVFTRFISTAIPFSLLTDGPRGMAQLLAVDAARTGLPQLQPYLRNFLDLRVEFLKCFPSAPSAAAADRNSIAQYLRVPTEDPVSTILLLVQCLLFNGHVFIPQEYIASHRPPPQTPPSQLPLMAPLAAPAVPVGGIVRLRGLPWTATVDDVKTFFIGLTIAPKGIHFVHNAHGKVTGEAFMQVLSQSDVTEALRRHRQTMGRRYVEVFKSSPQEMFGMTCRMGTFELRSLASKVVSMAPPQPQRLYVPQGYVPSQYQTSPSIPAFHIPPFSARIRGLPATVTIDELGSYFEIYDTVESRIHKLPASDTKHFCEAIVCFEDATGLQKALARSGSIFGQNQIEVLPASSDSRRQPTQSLRLGARMAGQTGIHAVPGPQTQPVLYGYSNAQPGASQDRVPMLPNHTAIQSAVSQVPVVRMRMVPSDTKEADIIDFFKNYTIRESGVVFGTDRDGRSSGDAWVSFTTPEQAEQAVAALNGKKLGKCTVEITMAHR